MFTTFLLCLAIFTTPANGQGCSDTNVDCPYWAGIGECQKNQWMLTGCAASCGQCSGGSVGICADQDPQKCPGWAQTGECSNNPDYMKSHCRTSCGLC